jgi:ABC-type sugar transport system substrate-binding protein
MKRLKSLFALLGFLVAGLGSAHADKGQIVYIVDTMGDPFWGYVALGIKDAVTERGYSLAISDSKTSAQNQLQNAQDAVAKHVAGIVLSPTDSSTAPAVLDLAAAAKIPVSFAGIGTESGEYVTYVTSDDEQGAYGAGQELAKALKAHGWNDGTVGMIQISQARQNGRQRSAGFEKAMKEGGYEVAAKNEMRLYTADETFKFAQDMLTANPEMRGIFVEAANASLGALRAIQASRRADQTLLVAFDGLPQFVDLIKNGDLVAAAMQQPYLMGHEAAESVIDSIEGKETKKTIALPVLAVTKDNMDEMLPVLEKTVFPKGSIK